MAPYYPRVVYSGPCAISAARPKGKDKQLHDREDGPDHGLGDTATGQQISTFDYGWILRNDACTATSTFPAVPRRFCTRHLGGRERGFGHDKAMRVMEESTESVHTALPFTSDRISVRNSFPRSMHL